MKHIMQLRWIGEFIVVLLCCFGAFLYLSLPTHSQTTEATPCTPEPTNMFISYGSVITCTLGTSEDVDIFKFYGNYGDNIIIQRSSEILGSPCIDLIAPNNSQMVTCEATKFVARMETSLTQTGIYTISVDDRWWSEAGQYFLFLDKVAPVSNATLPIRFGQIFTAEIGPVGDFDLFSFHGTAGMSITVEAARLTGDVSPCAELIAPNNTRTIACNDNHSNRINTRLLQTGIHTLIISSFVVNHEIGPIDIPFDGTGQYTLFLTTTASITNAQLFTIYLPIMYRNWLSIGPHLPLNYSPYRNGQSPTGPKPSPAQISEDMDILKQEANLIRTYGACDELRLIAGLAGQQGIYLYQGVWLSRNDAANQREIGCYLQLVPENYNILDGIIGSETLLRNDLIEAQLANYLMQAKPPGAPPVSSADQWAEWCNLRSTHPRCPGLPTLSPKADFIFIHVHPYWEAAPIEHAAAHVMAVQIYVNTTYTDTEVIVGETSWPTCGNPVGPAVPGLANQRRFIEEIWKWSKWYETKVFFFEAFDEAWKVTPGKEAEGCWGLYYADRTPKHPGLPWPLPTPPPTPATTAVRIDHPPANITTTTKSNCGLPIFGKVFHAQPDWKVKVEVFTNDWYIQNKWYLNGLAPIVDGKWAMPEVILAGQGGFNNHTIRAILVDAAGNPVGNPVISAEVGGIVRANACTP